MSLSAPGVAQSRKKGMSVTSEKAIQGGAHYVGSVFPVEPDGVRDTVAATSRRFRESIAVAGALAVGLTAAVVSTHAAAASAALPGGHGAAREHALAASAPVSREFVGQRDVAPADMLAFDAMRGSRAVRRGLESAALSEPDDPVGGVWVDRVSYEFSEGDSDARVAVTAESPPGDSRPVQTFEVSLSTRSRSGGAASGTDYAPISVHVRFSPEDFVLAGEVWRARQEIPLSIVNDMVVEDDEALDLLLERGSGLLPAWAVFREADRAAPCASRQCIVPVTILDDDGPSTGVAVSLGIHQVSESVGGQGALVTVAGALNREPLAGETVLTLRVLDGTATAPNDYARVEDFFLTVEAGETTGTASFALVPVDDRIDEDDETVTVMVVDSSDLDIVWSGSSEVAIADDDTRGVDVSTYLVPVDEGEHATYTVRLESEPTGTVSVAPSRASGDPDVTVFPTLEFNSLNWEMSQTVTVSAAEDLDADDDAAVIGHSVSGGDYGTVAVEPVMVSVADDDISEISPSPDALEVAEEDESGATYALALNSRPTGAVTVVVSGMAGTDVSVRPSSLVFTDQTWQRAQEVRVTAVADTDSVNDAVILEHRASGGGYDSTAVATVAVTVLDDDRRILLSATPSAIDEGAGPGSVAVRASYDGELADTVVTVRVVVGGETAPGQAIPGTDYQPVDGLEIVIAAGDAVGTGTFTFTPIEDNFVEPDEVVSIAGAADDSGIQISGTEVVIADNDEGPWPTITILDSTGNERDRSISFEVRLDAASDVPVRVRFSTAEDTALAGIDYESRSGVMVFEPGETRAALSVHLFADSVDEGKERFLVLLFDPENAELEDSEAVGTITNTDALPSAWLLRFGRAVAEDVAESIANRGNSARDAGAEVKIANQTAAGTAGPTFSGEDGFRWRGSTAGRGEPGFGPGATHGRSSERLRSWAVSGEELLEGTSYSATSVDPDGNSLSIWGSGSVSRFQGSDRGVSLEGDAATGLIGADYTSG